MTGLLMFNSLDMSPQQSTNFDFILLNREDVPWSSGWLEDTEDYNTLNFLNYTKSQFEEEWNRWAESDGNTSRNSALTEIVQRDHCYCSPSGMDFNAFSGNLNMGFDDDFGGLLTGNDETTEKKDMTASDVPSMMGSEMDPTGAGFINEEELYAAIFDWGDGKKEDCAMPLNGFSLSPLSGNESGYSDQSIGENSESLVDFGEVKPVTQADVNEYSTIQMSDLNTEFATSSTIQMSDLNTEFATSSTIQMSDLNSESGTSSTTNLESPRKRSTRKSSITTRSETVGSPLFECNVKSEVDEAWQETATPMKPGSKRARSKVDKSPNDSDGSEAKRQRQKMYLLDDPKAKNAKAAFINRQKKKEAMEGMKKENEKLNEDNEKMRKELEQHRLLIEKVKVELEYEQRKNQAANGLRKVVNSAKDVIVAVLPSLNNKFGRFQVEVAPWFSKVDASIKETGTVDASLGGPIMTSNYITLHVNPTDKIVRVDYRPDDPVLPENVPQ